MYARMQLAYEAFKNAQGIAPDCIEAWIGQAVVAETIGDKEAMDLFRHSTELGYHVSSARLSLTVSLFLCMSMIVFVLIMINLTTNFLINFSIVSLCHGCSCRRKEVLVMDTGCANL